MMTYKHSMYSCRAAQTITFHCKNTVAFRNPRVRASSSILITLTTTIATTKTPETDPCTLSQCKNNGICYSEKGQAKCECSLPYFGSFCEHTRNPCQFSKCLNGGTCAPNEDFTDYTCLCQKDFKGLLCEKGIGERLKNFTEKNVWILTM